MCTSIEINGRTRTSLDFPAGYFKRVVFYFGYRVCGIASDRTTGPDWGGGGGKPSLQNKEEPTGILKKDTTKPFNNSQPSESSKQPSEGIAEISNSS